MYETWYHWLYVHLCCRLSRWAGVQWLFRLLSASLRGPLATRSVLTRTLHPWVHLPSRTGLNTSGCACVRIKPPSIRSDSSQSPASLVGAARRLLRVPRWLSLLAAVPADRLPKLECQFWGDHRGSAATWNCHSAPLQHVVKLHICIPPYTNLTTSLGLQCHGATRLSFNYLDPRYLSIKVGFSEGC